MDPRYVYKPKLNLSTFFRLFDQEKIVDMNFQKCEPNLRKIWLTMKEGAYMGADFRFLSRSQQKEMEIKRDTIMTSYFKEMTLGVFFFLSLQLIGHDVHFKAIGVIKFS